MSTADQGVSRAVGAVRGRARAHLLVALSAVALTVGCSTTDRATGPMTSGPTAAVTPILRAAALPSHVLNSAHERSDVVQTSCAAIPGGWSAAGTVRNTLGQPATYRITVFFTTTHATTLDYAVATVKVPARTTRRWTAAKRFAAQPQMLCPMPGIAKVR